MVAPHYDRPMKKALLTAALVVGLLILAKLFGPKVQNIDWEKRFEQMPENAPPKWIFRNITAIRENTDRILELLDHDRSPSTTPGSTAT
jgi:hypothetical protein